MKKIDKLVLTEFIPLFFVGVLAFSVIMASITLLREVLKYLTEYNLDITTVASFFILSLPQVLVWTFPMAVLLSGLLSFGRLSSNQEITAIRAGGVSFGRILLPVILASWVIICLTFVFNEKIAPQAIDRGLDIVKTAMVAKGLSKAEYDISYFNSEEGWMFGASEGDGKEFTDVILIDFIDPSKTVVYIAKKALWSPSNWRFIDVQMKGFSTSTDASPWGLTSPELDVSFQKTPGQIMYETKDPEQMSLQELKQYILLRAQEGIDENRIRHLWSKYHFKIAAPFACLIFVLISAPLGMNPHRGTSTVGMGLSMIIVFIYYILFTLSLKWGEGGLLPPIAAAWVPNLLFSIYGLWLNARYYFSIGR